MNPKVPIQPMSRAPMAHPNKSIPSPRSCQCRMPHGVPPQINSIAQIQSHAPMARPHKSIASPRSSLCRTPHGAPPQINSITPIQPRPHDTSPHRCVCGAPDRRSPHSSTIATSHWLHPKVSRYRDCKCGKPLHPASDLGRSPHLVAVTWKYKKLV